MSVAARLPSEVVLAEPLGQNASAAAARLPELAPIVSYRDVTRSYVRGQPVVDCLDLDIRRGEFMTFLGPSGSGKTTTLMLLAGFEQPDSGRIYLNGNEIQSVPAHRRNIGVVFQNYSLFPHLTVGENIAYPLRIRKVDRSRIAERVRKALDTVRLPGLADRLPAMLSGGQQQRVALARALVFDPQVILMDEPLGALDKNLREHMQLEIKAIHERLSATFVYVTHDQSEALTMSDRIAVFENGKISQLAPPQVLYDDPGTVFVADFMGDNNRVSAKVLSFGDGRCVARTADGAILECRLGHSVDVDAAIDVCVRPERLFLDPVTADHVNRLEVKVEKRVFFGDHYRIYCRTSGLDEVMLKIQHIGDHQVMESGSSLSLRFKISDCIAFRAGPAPNT